MKKFLLMIASLLIISGCAGPSIKKSQNIVYGLSKQQVVRILGEPMGKEKSGNIEYFYYQLKEGAFSRAKYDYFIKMENKKVVAFGHHGLPEEAGD